MSKAVIICVDDEKIVLSSLKMQLRAKIGDNYSIETAESGEEALELCKELLEDGAEIPVIISDYIMPGLRGDELLKEVHSLSPNTVKILLTGQATIEGVTNAINNASLYRYIAKPWEKEDLGLTLTEALRSYYNDRLLEEKNRQLMEINNNLEDMVLDRTKELLEAREQLLMAEKMVAMGRLVAGIAHEINTPTGIAVTSASYLEEKTKSIDSLYKKGKMDRNDFEKYLNTCGEATTIILNNLNRASELVKSFKQVAVDQSSECKRAFNVKEYLEQILLSLKPRLKCTKHSVSIICEENLMIESYPGAISQIITNLIFNSLTHAFNDDDEGKIALVVEKGNNKLQLKYSDNGKGIKEEHIKQIFEPFFTTNRARGGTGLGLNVVYNLITQRLGGTIRCESNPGKGTVFYIDFAMD